MHSYPPAGVNRHVSVYTHLPLGPIRPTNEDGGRVHPLLFGQRQPGVNEQRSLFALSFPQSRVVSVHVHSV